MKNDTHVSDIDLPETFPDVDGEDGEGKGLKKGKIKKLNENKENSLWGAPFDSMLFFSYLTELK